MKKCTNEYEIYVKLKLNCQFSVIIDIFFMKPEDNLLIF